MAKIKKAAKPTKSKERLGHPGYNIVGGYLLNTEKNSRLNGVEKYKEYSNLMLNLAIVGAGVRFFLNLISSVSWKFEPSNPNDLESKRYSERVQYILNDMETPWHRVVRRASMYRFYGFSIQEWTAKLNAENEIGFLDIEPRPQSTIERWEVDDHGSVLGAWQRNPNNQAEVLLPRYKILYCVDDTLHTSPEGIGVFRNIVESAQRLQRYLQLEGFGYEMDIRGVPIGRAPLSKIQKMVDDGDIDKAQAAAIKEPIENILKNHVKNPYLSLLLDSVTYTSTDDAETPSQVKEWDIEFAKSEVGSQDSIAKAIERETFYIAILLGIEGLLLGGTKVGTYSLGDNKSNNLALIIDSTLREVSETVQNDIIKPLFSMNGWPDDKMPVATTDKVQLKEVTEITQALRDLADAGFPMMPDDPAINEVREMLGVSPAKTDATDSDVSLTGSSEHLDENLGGENDIT